MFQRPAPPAAEHEITPLSSAEAQRLIKAAEGDRMQARWLVGLALGLRQGEALGLWWDDLDLDAGLLRVRRALQRRRGGGLVFTEPKTSAASAPFRFLRSSSPRCASIRGQD
jgi:integrase